MQTGDVGQNFLLPTLSSWDVGITDMQETQCFMSEMDDMTRYNDLTSVLKTEFTQQFSQTTSVPSMSDTQLSSKTQRKLEINRKSQARVRARRKARIQSTETHLAEATAQLEDLKAKYKQISARNSLLEKIASMHEQPGALVTKRDGRQQWQAACLHSAIAEPAGSIIVTVNGHNQVFTAHEISHMPELSYADLYARYANKLGTCLLEMSDDDNNPANQQLTKWVCEVTSLMVCMAQGNPKLALKHGLADFTSTKLNSEELPPHRQDVFLGDLLLALELTEAQQRDMMHLRRLLFSKLGQLYRDRKAWLSSLSADSVGMCEASDKLAEMTDAAESLRNSGAEELSIYMQFSSAFFGGIQTCKQHATLIVHSYPAIPEKGRLLELLAAHRGEPSKEELMQPAGLDNLQHAANWQQVADYLQFVNEDNLNQHVPLLLN